MRAALPLLLAVALALLDGRGADADRSSAEFFAQRGEKALKDKDWATAEERYRKALEEDPTYLPAHIGIAEALLGAGQRGPAIEEYRKLTSEADAAPAPLPAPWVAIVAKAKKRLAEIDAAGAELDQIVDKRVADLVAFSTKWLEKDPEFATRALAEAKRLRPSSPQVAALEGKLGKVDTARRTHVWNGADWKQWAIAVPDFWKVEDRTIVADIPAGDAVGTWTRETWKGDFDVLMEMKVVEERGGSQALVALQAAEVGQYDCSAFVYFSGDLQWHECHGPNDYQRPFTAPASSVVKAFDPKSWNWYEMRFRGDKMYAVVNGTVVWTSDRPKNRGQGAVGVRVQSAKVLIRAIDVVQR